MQQWLTLAAGLHVTPPAAAAGDGGGDATAEAVAKVACVRDDGAREGVDAVVPGVGDDGHGNAAVV